MSSLSVFDFEDHPVRFVGTPDAPEWVAADICGVLGVKNVSDAIERLEDYQKGSVVINDISSSTRKTISVLTVKEAGLYALIFTSRKDAAKRFQRWVFEEVLPSIRKNGYYIGKRSYVNFHQARISGKYSRRSLTDAIKGYIERHPELSENWKKWIYKNVTDALYQQTHHSQARKLVELIGCGKEHLRDALSLDELVVISSIEDTAIRLIDQDVEPQAAIVQSAQRVLAVGLFSDRYKLLTNKSTTTNHDHH